MAQKKEAKVIKVGSAKGTKLFMLPYTRTNYLLMIAGVMLVIIGFALMAGGKQQGAEFKPDEIYSARRIVLAPIVVVLGFVVEVFAVMWLPKKKGAAPAS